MLQQSPHQLLKPKRSMNGLDTLLRLPSTLINVMVICNFFADVGYERMKVNDTKFAWVIWREPRVHYQQR